MKLLISYDGSEPSIRAMEKAHQLTADCGVHEVTIIHVYRENYWVHLGDGYAPSPEMLRKLEDYERSQIDDKKEQIQELAKMFDDTEAVVDIKMVHGHPARVITKVAEEGKYDLILM